MISTMSDVNGERMTIPIDIIMKMIHDCMHAHMCTQMFSLFTSQPPSQAGPPRMQDGRTLPESCMTDNVTYPCIPVVHNVHDHEGATTLDYKAPQIWGFMKIEKSPGKEVNKARDSLLVSERPILQK